MDTQINARDPSTHALFPLKLYDNGDGTYSLDQELVDVAAIKDKTDYLQNLEDAVYFDSTVTANTSTTWPSGTAQNPTTSIASAKTMADARNVKKICINGSVTLLVTMEGYTFIGINEKATITLGGCDVDTSHFYNCTVTGVQGGTGYMYLHNSTIKAVSGYAAYTYDCDYENDGATPSVIPRSSSTSYAINPRAVAIRATAIPIAVYYTSITTAKLTFIGATGYWGVAYMTNANCVFDLYGAGAIVNSDSTNTAGSVIVWNDTYLEKGGTATQTDKTLYAQVGSYVGDGGILITSSIKAELDLMMTSVSSIAAKSGQFIVKTTTCDLHNSIYGAQDLVICSAQDVIIDSLIFSPRIDVSDDTGAFTGISVHDDDTTPNTYIAQANGVKAGLTAYRQLSWTGATKLRVGKRIQATIYGGPADADPTTCDVEITYHTVKNGGSLELPTSVLYECPFCTDQYSYLYLASDVSTDFVNHIMAHIGAHWDETGTPGWIDEDLNHDGVIGVGDMVMVGQGYFNLVELTPGVFKIVFYWPLH